MKTDMTVGRLTVLLGICVGGAFGVLAAPPVTNGLKLWLDASDASSVTTNASGKVSQWNDLSGGGYNATQGAPSSQPTYNPTGLNARASLVFNGANVMTTSSFICFSNHTVFVVAQATATNESDILGSGTIAAGDILMMNYRGKYRGHYWTSNSVLTTLDSATLSVLTPAIYAQRLDDAALKTYRNGQLDATGVATAPHTDLVKPVCLGSRFLSGGTGFAGRMSEILIYDRALSDAERMQVEDYLADKWLPSITKPGAPPVTGGLKLWLDASDITTLVTNGSGKVSQWNNQATLWRHASQGTGGYQPAYVPVGINWHPALSFNGTNALSTAAFLNFSNHTVFVVAQAVATSAHDILGSGTAAGDILLMHFAGKYRGHYWITPLVQIDSTLPAVLTPIVYEQLLDDASLKLYRSGQSDGTKAAGAPHQGILKAVSLGNRSPGPNSSSFIGQMSEVLIYNRALSDAERIQVEAYLYAKWLVPRKGTLIRVY